VDHVFSAGVALLCPNFINTATLLEIDQDLIYTFNSKSYQLLKHNLGKCNSLDCACIITK
jgi:hypothetical protein